jgi:hypothetical protein
MNEQEKKEVEESITLSEEIVRAACIKVLADKHLELAKRSYPPPRILLELADEMRALKF